MGTTRKLAAVLACTALLGMVGTATAGAQDQGRCDKASHIAEKIEAKKAKVAVRRARFEARQQDHPRATDWLRKHEARFDTAIARIEVKASKALQGCST